MAASPFHSETGFHFQSLSLPGLPSVHPEPRGAAKGGGGGSMNVLIRTGSPDENTQRYLYILFREGSSPRARRSGIETDSCPFQSFILEERARGETSDPEGICTQLSPAEDHAQPR